MVCMILDLVGGPARALELFIEALIVKSSQVTHMYNSRTLSASHMCVFTYILVYLCSDFLTEFKAVKYSRQAWQLW